MGHSPKSPTYDLQKAQNEQIWAADQNRKYGQVNVNSDLGGYQYITNPDGTQTLQTNLSDNDKNRLNLVKKGLSSIDMSYPDMSEIENFNTDGQAQADAAYNMATRYLNQDFDKQRESLASDLANKGIPVGSAAYNSAMQSLNDSQNMALSQAADNAIFSGQNYAQNQLNLLGSKANTLINRTANQISNVNNLTAGINNPLNSIVSGVGGEFGGNYNSQFNAEMNKYNQKMASRNAAISAGASALGAVGGAVVGGLI